MGKAEIRPHKVRNPIQLLAVWFSALVLLDGTLLTAAGCISQPAWVRPMLTIAAVVFVPLFLFAAIVMQTKFRTHLLDDPHFAEWLRRKEKMFEGFTPENVVFQSRRGSPTIAPPEEVKGAPEDTRIRMYERQSGIFLTHDWLPSRSPGQVADIMISLHQHRDGPLSRGEVEKVEYYLGPKFFGGKPVVKTNSAENFLLEVSAYGPMLCLALVFVKGERQPLEIYRYIDFTMTADQRARAHR